MRPMSNKAINEVAALMAMEAACKQYLDDLLAAAEKELGPEKFKEVMARAIPKPIFNIPFI